MKVLSISTATDHLSLALTQDDRLIAQKEEQDERNHSEHLAPLIDQLLKENQLTLKQVDRFAVAIGPGSYTGLRIGVTTVKMFASILHKDLVGISTLQALAQGVITSDALVLTELDARNHNFFAGAYIKKGSKMQALIPDGHYHLSELAKGIKIALKKTRLNQILIVGSPFSDYENDFEAELKGVKIEQEASLTKNKIQARYIGFLAQDAPCTAPDDMVPHYLRRTQAEIDWQAKTGQAFGPESDYVEEV